MWPVPRFSCVALFLLFRSSSLRSQPPSRRIPISFAEKPSFRAYCAKLLPLPLKPEIKLKIKRDWIKIKKNKKQNIRNCVPTIHVKYIVRGKSNTIACKNVQSYPADWVCLWGTIHTLYPSLSLSLPLSLFVYLQALRSYCCCFSPFVTI